MITRQNITPQQRLGLIVGLLLASVSATADGYAYYSINPSVGFVLLAIAIVSALVLVKAQAAIFLPNSRGLNRLGLIALLGLLVALSGATGVYFFKSRLDNHTAIDVRTSQAYQRSQQQQQRLETQQQALIKQLTACPAGWLTKCVTPLQQQLQTLQQQQQQSQTQQQSLTTGSSSLIFWQGVATSTGWSINQLHWSIFGGLSILIDLLSLFGFALYGHSTTTLKTHTKKPAAEKPTEPKAAFNPALGELENNILSGEIRPSVTQLKKHHGLNSPQAASVLNALWEDGYLKREIKNNSRYYRLKKTHSSSKPSLKIVANGKLNASKGEQG